MLRWLQQWLPLSPRDRRSAESWSVDAAGQPILATESEWLIELGGTPIALLSEPRWEEMFWTSYRITPLTDDPSTLAKLQDIEFWRVCESHGVVFRHRASSAIAQYAFPGLAPFPEPGRLIMRGLYA